jgi:hypothetical protein
VLLLLIPEHFEFALIFFLEADGLTCCFKNLQQSEIC